MRTAAKGSGETRNAISNPTREAVGARELNNNPTDRTAINSRSADRASSYQRTPAERAPVAREREIVRTPERVRAAEAPTRQRIQSPSVRENTYYRGNPATRIDSRQAGRTTPSYQGNVNREPQRNNQNINGYNRNPGNDYYRPQQTRPSNERYQRPSNDNRYSVPSRNYSAPSRNYQAPSRNEQQAPSRNYQAPSRESSPSRPSRNYDAPSRNSPSRSVSPNRGSSGGSFSTPNRSSGSFNSGGRGGGMSSPSRSSGGSRGGRP